MKDKMFKFIDKTSNNLFEELVRANFRFGRMCK